MSRKRPLTTSPSPVLTMQDYLSSRSTRYVVETLDCIRYAVYRFETFTYDSVDRGPGKCELQTI